MKALLDAGIHDPWGLFMAVGPQGMSRSLPVGTGIEPPPAAQAGSKSTPYR